MTSTGPTVGSDQPLRWLISICLLTLSFGSTAKAVGIRLPNQDPEAIARGDAFVATADNPSAIYYNPAGITQLEGQNLRAGLYLISPGVTFKPPGGASVEADSAFQPVPQLYYVNTLKNLPLSFGLGVYAPYGLALDWGNNVPFRTAATSGELKYLCFNPVVAWKISPSLSIAIGPTINYSTADLKRGISPLNPADEFRAEGEDTAFGFNAGIRWQPHEKWAFGLNYRAATTMEYQGTSEAFPYFPATDTTAKMNFPQFVVGGVSFRPNEKWNLEFDLDWTDWSDLKGIEFQGTLPGPFTLPLNYRSSLIYDFGVTRQLGDGYFASVGYIYSENSSPDTDFNPLIADGNLHLGSIGLGHRGERWDWAVGYHFAFNGSREVSGNTNPSVDGTYRVLNHAFNLAVTLKF